MESGGFSPSPLGDPTLINFSLFLAELHELAQKHAQDYLDIHSTLNQSDQIEDAPTRLLSIIETYKILIFPDRSLGFYFKSMSGDALKKEFKRLAVLIHPDKNKHPNAKLAFQKLYNNFMAALTRNN